MVLIAHNYRRYCLTRAFPLFLQLDDNPENHDKSSGVEEEKNVSICLLHC
jgi:hypothetical protein